MLLAASACTQKIYVSPDGIDSADGKLSSPLASLECALSRVDSTKRTSIILREGQYRPAEPLRLIGFKNLTIKSFHSEKVSLRGDVAIEMHPIEDGELPWISDSATRSRILKADLKDFGITDFGEPAGLHNRFDLYCNGERQPSARWPEDHYLHAGQNFGKTPTPSMAALPEEQIDVFWEGDFDANTGRVENWRDEHSGAVQGYMHYDWNHSSHRIKAIEGKRIKVDSRWSRYGFKSGLRYIAYNILHELDSAGEYYVDTESGLLYWFTANGYAPDTDELSYPVFRDSAMMTVSCCRNLKIKGISLQGMRNDALHVRDSKKVKISRCRFRDVGANAMIISTCHDLSVKKCIVENCGQAGIKAAGGDRVTLSPAGYVFKKNLFRNFSQLKFTYEPGLNFVGCGAIIRKNEFYSCPSSGMRLEGNDILVEKNYLHDLVSESDDQGALDIFGNYYYRNIVIRRNRFEDIRGRNGSAYGAAAVRLDDLISGIEIKGNSFRNCGGKKFGAIQIHGGKDNIVEGNLFESCPTAISFAPWDEDRWRKVIARKGISVYSIPDSVQIGNALYLQRYPALKEDINANINRNFILHNRIIDCGRPYFREWGHNVLEGNVIK